MKIKNKFLLGASCVLLALACSDDSSSSAKKEFSNVSSEKDLPKCEKSTSGDEFCVESLKAGVFCEASSGKWTVDSTLTCEFENSEDSLDAKDSATSSSAGENSSSSAADSKVSSSSVAVSSSSEEKSSAREESSSSEEALVPASSSDAPSIEESSSSSEPPPVPESSSSIDPPPPFPESSSSEPPALPESSSSEPPPVPESSSSEAPLPKITSFGDPELEFLLEYGWFSKTGSNQWEGDVDSREDLVAALLANGFEDLGVLSLYQKEVAGLVYQVKLGDVWVSVDKFTE